MNKNNLNESCLVDVDCEMKLIGWHWVVGPPLLFALNAELVFSRNHKIYVCPIFVNRVVNSGLISSKFTVIGHH